MEVVYENVPFKNEVLNFENLTIDKVVDLLHRVVQHPFCQTVSAHLLENGNEGLVFDVEVEVPQYPKIDIRSTERILVVFDKTDKTLCEVFALRSNFPKAPHQNIKAFEFPKWLCLYEQPYHELKLTWTSASFLEQIRNWLKLTSIGKLHGDDQPLEPFLLGFKGNIILPPVLDEKRRLFVSLVSRSKNEYNFIASHQATLGNSNQEFHALFFSCKPQLHGIVNAVPSSYNELYDLLLSSGNDLSSFLQEKIKQIFAKSEHIINSKPLLIIEIPVKRNEESSEVRKDYYCFCFVDSIADIDVKLNISAKSTHNKNFAELILSKTTKSDENIPLVLLKPHFPFDTTLGAKLNNLPTAKDVNLLMIGAGAIGSQIFLNIARMGFGKWSIIDDDILLPHNLARHAFYSDVGSYKSEALSFRVNAMLGNENFSNGLVDNFISPQNPELIEKAISETNVIVDCSASIAVARKLAATSLDEKRCVSIFLNTTGTDLVILAENLSRDIKLDALEMQYYRELITNPALDNHLSNISGSIRYAASCRDISNRIPQDFVALHAAIGTNFIKRITQREESKIGIWKIDEESLNVTHFDIQPYPVSQQKLGGWDIIIDSFLENKLFKAREDKLPNETGGVLIGTYDLERKKIYIVDTILSPKDSIESPYEYYRGIEGLKDKLENIQKKTISNLRYIGEWHSHPPKVSLEMSAADKVHYTWVREHFEKMDLPPLTMIVGEGNYRIYNNLKESDYD